MKADAALEGRHAARTRRDQRRGLGAHLVEELAGRVGIERVEPHVAAAHQLVGDRRRKEADGRADAGIGRHDHALHADLLGDARGMQRRAAAEGDQIVLVDDGAALDGVHARGTRHVLRHHLVDGVGRHARSRARGPRRRRARARPWPRSRSSAMRAAGEVVRIDRAQHDIGVGHGRMHAAAAVAGRARLGAGALRPHRHALQRIDARDRAAAGADLDHLDHRDAHRQARCP